MEQKKMTVSKFSRTKPPAEEAGAYAIGLEVLVTNWLAVLQLNHKMPNSLVARKMRTTPKHVEAIMGGTPTLQDLANMFHALGYKMRIHVEDIKTGEKHMQQPELLPHALKHPHIRGQLEKPKAKK
jgi:hypothetical protein